jgi:hypothetical protein
MSISLTSLHSFFSAKFFFMPSMSVLVFQQICSFRSISVSGFFSKFAQFHPFLFPVFSANLLNSIHFCSRFLQQIFSIPRHGGTRGRSGLVTFSSYIHEKNVCNAHREMTAFQALPCLAT